MGAGSGVNSLYSVTATGTPTLIGPTGVFAGGGTGFLSTSNDSKKLYWEVQTNCTDALYSINTSTGAATLMGSATGCFPSTTGNPFQMVFTGGTLWANFYADGFGTITTGGPWFRTNAHAAYFDSLRIHSPVVTPSASRFVPVTPCRIADTRSAAGPFGGPGLPRQTSRDFAIPNSACGIPSTAVAYSLNVAVVPSGTLGFLTLWPTGQTQPLVATLNSFDGRIKSNAAIVPAGAQRSDQGLRDGRHRRDPRYQRLFRSGLERERAGVLPRNTVPRGGHAQCNRPIARAPPGGAGHSARLSILGELMRESRQPHRRTR